MGFCVALMLVAAALPSSRDGRAALLVRGLAEPHLGAAEGRGDGVGLVGGRRLGELPRRERKDRDTDYTHRARSGLSQHPRATSPDARIWGLQVYIYTHTKPHSLRPPAPHAPPSKKKKEPPPQTLA